MSQPQVSRSVIHITVTAAGTVVYTQTSTSYSYIPSYSTIAPSGTSMPSNNGNVSTGNESPNVGAIVGGVVGGLAAIVLIGLGAFFLHKTNKNKSLQPPPSIDDDDSYYEGQRHQRSSSKANILSPTARHPAEPRANEFIYYDVPHLKDHAEPPHTRD